MSKYIDADLLRKEIEKGTPNQLEVLVYKDIILSLIDSLQQEQPVIKKSNALFDKCVENCDPAVMKEVSDNIDKMLGRQPVEELEEEIDACWQNWLSPSNQKEVEGVLPKTEFAMYARHFYELGCRRAAVMYDDIEYERQRTEEAEITNNLKEEYKDYVENDPVYSKLVNRNTGLGIARHFAEWQKKQDQETIELAEDHAMLAGMNKMEQQMMEKAYDTVMQFDELDDLVPTFENMQKFGFKVGDKVKVIILKEK